jgi:hypothetical protein
MQGVWRVYLIPGKGLVYDATVQKLSEHQFPVAHEDRTACIAVVLCCQLLCVCMCERVCVCANVCVCARVVRLKDVE